MYIESTVCIRDVWGLESKGAAESSLCVGVEPIGRPPHSGGAQALWWRITVNNCAVGCQEHLV